MLLLRCSFCIQALTFGSSMIQGVGICISGQEAKSSLRHTMLVDQMTEGVIVPFDDELKVNGKSELANSEQRLL